MAVGQVGEAISYQRSAVSQEAPSLTLPRAKSTHRGGDKAPPQAAGVQHPHRPGPNMHFVAEQVETNKNGSDLRSCR